MGELMYNTLVPPPFEGRTYHLGTNVLSRKEAIRGLSLDPRRTFWVEQAPYRWRRWGETVYAEGCSDPEEERAVRRAAKAVQQERSSRKGSMIGRCR